MGKVLQLELIVSGLEHEVNRIIEVEEHRTFEQLNEMIHILFNFELESYLFHIFKSNGQSEDAYIGMDFDQDFLIDESLILDDEEEVLVDWLNKENDCAEYTVATHDTAILITLKKRLNAQKTVAYPRCIAGQGHIEGPEQVIDIDSISEELSFITAMTDELMDEFLHGFMDDVDEPEPDWQALFEVAEKLKKLKPWVYLEDHQVIVVEHPDTQLMLYICVMGAADQEYGLAIYEGDEGRKTIENIQLNNLPPDFYLDLQSLNVSFVDRDELTEEDYQLIKSQGLSFRGKKNWIQFRSYLPGQFPWIPDSFEAEHILYAMIETLAVVEKCKAGWVFPELPLGTYYFRQMEYVNDEVQMLEHIISFDEAEKEIEPIVIDISEFELKQLSKKKTGASHLEFDLLYLPQPVQDTPGERPYYPLLVVALDRVTGTIVHQQILSMDKELVIAQISFVEMVKALPSKPSTVYVSKEMYTFIANLADAMKLKLVQEELIAIQDFKRFLQEMP